jgi:hypothetical protein
VGASIVRISIAPVKSCALVHPESVMLEPEGVVGNRRFWLRDERGALYGGKRDGTLQRVHPVWEESTRRLSLSFPGGERVEGIVELGDPVEVELYRLPLPSHRVIGPWEAALSRYVGRPLQFLWADHGAVDRTPEGGTVSVVSRGSLERLREEAGAADAIDGRRFRMLFEIDGVAAHEEDEWMSGQVQVGDAVLALNGDVGRCVVTTQNPDTGESDLDTLGVLARYRREGRFEKLPFGVYGSVAVPGRVRVGDAVQPLQSALLTPT